MPLPEPESSLSSSSSPSNASVPLWQVFVLTALAMIAFAANSLLCRLALKNTSINPASFTAIRLTAGAVLLWGLTRRGPILRKGKHAHDAEDHKRHRGNTLSAAALFVYAAAFSFAYVTLSAASGALILFGAVQITMIAYGSFRGERFAPRQYAGLALAMTGLVALLLPGLSAPPWQGALLMGIAGVAWGVYSLRGRGAGDPLHVTGDNFRRAAPMALLLALVTCVFRPPALDMAGVAWAVASGAIASGIGYAIWYTALPALAATRAATVQLSVPALAAFGGVLFLGEAITLRLALCSVAILGGIALVILEKRAR
jgi:drug/metabolite transporter (DMT)-like permease